MSGRRRDRGWGLLALLLGAIGSVAWHAPTSRAADAEARAAEAVDGAERAIVQGEQVLEDAEDFEPSAGAGQRPQAAESVRWLAGEAVVLVAPGADLALPQPEAGVGGILGEGVACTISLDQVTLLAGSQRVTVVGGLACIEVDGDVVVACVEEGRLTAAGGTLTAGECGLLRASGELQVAPADRAPLPMLALPELALHPVVPDDPRALIELTASQSGRDAAGRDDESEREGGGGAACLESTGAEGEATGPEGSELPEREVDRDWHQVHLEVTLEDL